MHQGFYHPPVVRRGAHPIREYGATDSLVVVQPSGYYADTGGYAWYYDANSGVITMVASPKSREQLRFDVNHPRWKGIYDAVIAGKTPQRGGEVYAVAAKEGGNLTSAGGSNPGTPSRSAKPAPPDAKIPDSKGSKVTDAVWFWPVVILVPTVAVVAGLLLLPKKGKKASTKASRRPSARAA
jgi:hypothetical protein